MGTLRKDFKTYAEIYFGVSPFLAFDIGCALHRLDNTQITI